MTRGSPCLLLIAAFALGCRSSEQPTTPPSEPGVDAEAPTDGAAAEAPTDGAVAVAAFDSDPVPSGASLWVSLDLSNPKTPVATIHAKDLGEVFGISFHVRIETSVLAAQKGEVATFLGPDAPAQARYLHIVKANDISVGAVRRGPAAGATNLAQPVVLATIPMSVTGEGKTRIDIADAQVRRVDASFVSITTAGGLYRSAGAP